MPIVCGVRFRGTGKVYHFSHNDDLDLQPDDHVVVETARGAEIVQVAVPRLEIAPDDVVGELKPVLRRATATDLKDAALYQSKEQEAADKCRQQVVKAGLPMKIVSAEYSFDGSRLTFFFTSEERVDFRDLVRDLARSFRTRIELRQIGVRDEARIVGGLGKCGRTLCCKTWLNEFCPVSIRMAKQQDLPLSPMEISGLCGRLLCCLGYENDHYKEIKAHFPKVGKRVNTPLGPAKVMRVSVLREQVTVLLEDGTTMDLTAEPLAGEAPLPVSEEGGHLSGSQRHALDALLETDAPESAPPHRDDGDRDGGDGSGGAPRRSRRNRPPRPAEAGEGSAGPAPQAQAPQPTASPEEGGPARSSRRRRRRRPERPNADAQPGATPSPAAAQAPAAGRAAGAPADRRRAPAAGEGGEGAGEGAPRPRRRSRSRRGRPRREGEARPAQEG